MTGARAGLVSRHPQHARRRRHPVRDGIDPDACRYGHLFQRVSRVGGGSGATREGCAAAGLVMAPTRTTAATADRVIAVTMIAALVDA